MIHRAMEDELRRLASEYPVVTITGPRQAGKTTLCKMCFPGYGYANLEDPKTRLLATEDYEGFLAKYPCPVVIDEIQRVPDLLSAIQVKVDSSRHLNGQFILTGSNQPLLQSNITQSLAGRTAILRLLPLTLQEMRASGLPIPSTDELLLRGFMPDLYLSMKRRPSDYYRYYVETYLERDIRQLQQIRHIDEFHRFIRLLAARVGQVVNLSSLSNEVGISSTMLSGWLSTLEASYLILRLPPYFSNRSKQLVKNPKIYFSEVGLASHLLGIEDASQMSRDPLRGSLFENLVVVEAYKKRLNANRDPRLFFLRTAKGFEIDLIQESGRQLVPMEIKSSMTYLPAFARNLKAFCAETPDAIDPAVIYAGEDLPSFDGIKCLNYLTAFA